MVTQSQTSERPASPRPAAGQARVWLPLLSWAVMLAVSVLPDALLHELTGASPEWLKWAKIGLLAAAAALTFLWAQVRPLRIFFVILLAIFAAEEAATWLGATAAWQARFSASGSFVNDMLGVQLLRLLVSLALIGVLLGLGLRRAQFFLMRGQLDAPLRQCAGWATCGPSPGRALALSGVYLSGWGCWCS